MKHLKHEFRVISCYVMKTPAHFGDKIRWHFCGRNFVPGAVGHHSYNAVFMLM